MNNDYFQQVLNEYNNLEFEARDRLKQRQAIVYSKIPEIEKIDDEIRKNTLKIPKLFSLTKDERKVEFEKISLENKSLLQKKKELMLANGFDENYLVDIYRCNICKDTGFVDNKRCKCLIQKLADKAYEMSNLKELLNEQCFEKFDFSFYPQQKGENDKISPYENITYVYKNCEYFIKNFDKEFNNILFYGQPGVGKTFLCSCIAKAILDKGFAVLYFSASGLFKIIEEERFNKNESSFDKLNKLKMVYDCDLLIIDDIGTEFSTAVTISEFFNIINDRIIRKKPTILSTNFNKKDISNKYSYRFMSRFIENYMMLNIYTDDIRKQKKLRALR